MATDPQRGPPSQLPILDKDLCSGCNACITVCPADCIHAIADSEQPGYVMGIRTIDLTACIGCRDCVRVCPWNAIIIVPTSAHPRQRIHRPSTS